MSNIKEIHDTVKKVSDRRLLETIFIMIYVHRSSKQRNIRGTKFDDNILKILRAK